MRDLVLRLTVNGRPVSRQIPVNALLRDFLREDLGLTGTKGACDDGMCGSCSVHVDGEVVKACLMLAVEASDRSVTTIEGLAAPDGTLHPVQQALIDNFGFQCGFCTPGMAMTMAYLLESGFEPDQETARESLVGNICRCTGYDRIADAMISASRTIQGRQA
jgi:aerobic-type carbon monoxide dehydrogenase small subunit (CoxS/CutS family)